MAFCEICRAWEPLWDALKARWQISAGSPKNCTCGPLLHRQRAFGWERPGDAHLDRARRPGVGARGAENPEAPPPGGARPGKALYGTAMGWIVPFSPAYSY